MKSNYRKQLALEYHAKGKPGKIEVIPTKEAKTQRDLSLAYSPGVAFPCLEIADDKENVYKYTAKGNLVAVISNGTAVLGLGDIGPEAGKPVMEGKGVLFKIFADIDVFDIEINEKDPVRFVEIVKALEPTFGGINLEDIKAPGCFYIERELKKQLQIPVMHDDQHGTAIISGAALLNALEIQGKDIKKVRFVINGAGAAAIACSRLYEELGAVHENFLMFDSKGVLHKGRTDLDELKSQFAIPEHDISLVEAMNDADVFVGLSQANCISKDMVKSMATNPVVFAMANPDPEISWEDATAARKDIIMATGRSDYPNQVNNVLGFPYIFRGTLDVRAIQINEAMKLAAVYSLAELAKKPVPDIVNMAYNEKSLSFGPNYIIPKPLDPRLLTTVAPAVARAAMETGVARQPINDWESYENQLSKRLGIDNQLISVIGSRARKDPKRIVFAEADNEKILKAAQLIYEEGIGFPILLGNETHIRRTAKENHVDLDGLSILDPRSEQLVKKRKEYAALLFEKRSRKGISVMDSEKMIVNRNYYGSMMVECGDADVLISGLTKNYADTIRPALHCIGLQPGVSRLAGMYLLLTQKGPLFMADTTINFAPTANELAEITMLAVQEIRNLNIIPRVAMLSYSNFGSSNTQEAKLVAEARKIVKAKMPSLIIDGEVQGNVAFNKEFLKDNFPFSDLVDKDVNTLIFPNLSSGNISHNLLDVFNVGESIGPILIGLKKPVHVLQVGSSVRSIVNMALIAVVEAQHKSRKSH